MSTSVQLTPMLRHYLEVKAEHPDTVLLYRMGDFYELFFEDAVEAAPILEVTLTARNRGTESEAPMCGVPHHALDTYLGKLVRAGFRVAVCDQVEDPADSKGLVRREVTRIVTPGTVSDPGLLEAGEANRVAAIAWRGESGGGAFLDISTGEFIARHWRSMEDAADDLSLMRPREIVHNLAREDTALQGWLERTDIRKTLVPDEKWIKGKRASQLLSRQLGTRTLEGFGLAEGDLAVEAAASVLQYARDTQHSDLSHVQTLAFAEHATHLVLDAITVANLEIFETLRNRRRKGSLLWVLDQTVSAPGARLLREWLQRPLVDPLAIDQRLDAVDFLHGRRDVVEDLRRGLASIGDPERVVSRAVLGAVGPRELAGLREALRAAPKALAHGRTATSALLRRLSEIDPLGDLKERISQVLQEEPAVSVKQGGVIKEGFDPELDRLRSLTRNSKQHLLDLEKRERERTGIASLKIRFNKVFGYYLEVTKANQHLVPQEYVRKQTLVNSERYINEELKQLEERILNAEQGQIALEEEHFAQLVREVVLSASRIRTLSRGLATLDVLGSLTEVALRHDYVRPSLGPPGTSLVIEQGRHPVIERLSGEPFVPNDTILDPAKASIVILTGPNMGGKSTFLRQSALIAIMAQMGSFVPASAALVGVADRVFTRVGATDDLSRGESTFMVEMVETARILNQCTENSLVVLDEVGRGTATFDGLSLAWSIIEYLHAEMRPRTLFATHYHELTELAATLPGVKNLTMSVKEWEDRIVFLRKVVPGSANKSYGIHVARLAGIPEAILTRAAQILGNLEAQEYDLHGKPRLARGGPPGVGPDQLALFAPPEEVIAAVLRDVDVERLTAISALNLLHALKSRLGD